MQRYSPFTSLIVITFIQRITHAIYSILSHVPISTDPKGFDEKKTKNKNRTALFQSSALKDSALFYVSILV